ncbi:hypothetical protein glysoja_004687, partial [Glycine soja]
LWRLLRGCLPTRSNLRTKHIPCVCCEGNIENEWHLFLSCEFAQSIWVEADLWNFVEQKWSNTIDFHSFFFYLMQDSSPHVGAKIGVILWCMWKNRNSKLWEGNI